MERIILQPAEVAGPLDPDPEAEWAQYLTPEQVLEYANLDSPEDRAAILQGMPVEARISAARLRMVILHGLPEEQEQRAQEEEDEKQLRRTRALDAARDTIAAERANASLGFLVGEPRSLKDALLEGVPKATFAITGLLPEHGNATLVASNKTGKTTMMNHLTRAMVDDVPFLGEYDVQHGRVAFWNYEVGEDQWTRWTAEAGIQNSDLVFPLHLRGRTVSLRSPQARDMIAEWLSKREIQYWILDPGHRAMTGFQSKGDPNDAVMEFTEALDEVKQAAGVKSIIMPLHTGKNGDGARGATRWADWPDAIWTYTRDQKLGHRTLAAEGRDVELAESMITYNPTDRSLGINIGPLTEGQQEEKSLEQEILDFLVNNPDVHPKKGEIGQRLGRSKQDCMRAADHLVATNRAHMQTGARNAQMLYYGPANLLIRAPSPSELE